jgi:hypothetical protein
MDSKLRLALSSLALLALATTAFACAGTPIPAPIEGEPVCPDIDIGTTHATKMIGGLTYPVRLRILDGKNVMMKMILSGKRVPGDPSAHTLLPDDNAEYTLEWAQCDNVRAPRPATTASKTRKESKDATAYDCGDAKIYKTDKLVTKKHDGASHAFTFAAPPKAECWAGEVAPAAPTPPPAPVPPAATATPSAAPSASAVPSASAALTPSAAPVASAAPTPAKGQGANAAPTPINVPAPTK